MKVAIYVREDTKSNQVAQHLEELLTQAGHIIDNSAPQFVISVGGDGTFLRAAHHYIDQINDLVFIGVHTGTLGFFADFDEKNYREIVTIFENENLRPHKYNLIQATITYENETKIVYAINEIRLENPYHTLICDVEIDGTHLERFRGNGLNVCGVLGSSGYNRSLDGAILDNTLDVLQLSEIAAIHSNAYRSLGSPLVLNSNRKIFVHGDLGDAIIGYDYLHVPASPQKIKSVEFQKSTKTVCLFHYNSHTLIDTIRKSFVID